MKFKILKKGNYFVAYDIDSKNKNDLGKISIVTGKFVGNTVCLVELSNHLNTYLTEQFYKKAVESGFKFKHVKNSSHGFIGYLIGSVGEISIYNECFYVTGDRLPINVPTLALIQKVQELFRAN